MRITPINSRVCFTILILLFACTKTSSNKSATDIILPPDPSESGKATLAGVDSDRDGVRDDIQRYIVLTYPDQPEIQKALRQYAKAHQDYILGADDPLKTKENAIKADKSIECLFSKATTDSHSKIFDQIHAEFLNTKERILANSKADSHLSGQVFSDINKDKAKSCDDH